MQTIAPSVLFPVFNSPYPQGTQLYLNVPNFSFGQDAKIAHFIGASKPWHIQLDLAGELVSGSGGEHTSKHLMYWWQIFHSDVSNKQVVTGDGGSSQPDYRSASGYVIYEGPAHEQGSGAAGAAGPSGDDRRERWEVGHPDYMGSASFDNILKKLESTMSTPGECEMQLARIFFFSLRQRQLFRQNSHTAS